MNRLTRDEWLMGIAQLAAKRSTCQRRQVGAIIARGGRPISSGYAGSPAGQPHCLDVGCEILATNPSAGCQRTVHAELNAIAYAARYGISTEGATLYCTLSPCLKCAQAIINSGIKEVVFSELYRDPSGIQLLNQSGVKCTILNALSVTVTKTPPPSATVSRSSAQGELF